MSDDDDKEATRIIARPGPKSLPFRVETPIAAPRAEPRLDRPAPPPLPTPPPAPAPAPAAAPAPAGVVQPPARPAVIVPPVGRPAVMQPPGGPARAGRSPLVAPPVVDLPGATPKPVTAPPAAPAAVVPPPQPPAAAVAPAPAVAAAAIEPVVGWLVILKGPGRGASLTLRTGRNALGAAPGQDVQIAFGDPAIALVGHAFIVYDEEARAFFIEDGKKKDLVRVNGRMLTETRPLAAGDEIRIGATTLRFVAFCGADFDWSEPQPAAPAAADAATPDDSGAGI